VKKEFYFFNFQFLRKKDSRQSYGVEKYFWQTTWHPTSRSSAAFGKDCDRHSDSKQFK
jgi:hypothetical protein